MRLKALMETEITMRAKNQFTLPEKIARKLGIKKGDRFVVSVDDKDTDLIQIRRLRDSYFGVAAGLWGEPCGIEDYVRGERDAWEQEDYPCTSPCL